MLGITNSTAQCPTVASILPASGPANTVVTITGNNFQSGSGITSVQFNGINAAGFVVVSNTQVKAIVPATGTTGTISLASSTCTGTSGTSFSVLSSDCEAVGPQDLYISELYDHVPGSYGVIELYNPTNNTINMTGVYVLTRAGDWDGPASYTLNLTGSIGPQSTYLALSYGSGVQGCTVATQGNLGNGINDDDDFKLWKNGSVIDRVQAPSYTGYTVIRKPNAIAPEDNYNANDWTFTGTFTCANLGSHTTNLAPVSNIVTQPVSATTCENGAVQFTVALNNATGFTYQWKMLTDAGTWVNVTNGGSFSGATTATLSVDPALMEHNGDQYYCQITSGDCILLSNAVQVTVSPLPVVTLDITQPTCDTPTGTITITPSIGEGLTYQINADPFQTSNIFTGLEPGDYILTIKSGAGCITSMDVTIDAVPSAPAVAQVTTEQPTCAEPTGTITVTSPVGAGFTYAIDGETFVTTTEFAGLVPGTYQITVKNAGGCTSVTGNIVINAVPAGPAVATYITTQPTCTTPTGAITVTSPLGAGLNYAIDGVTFGTGTTFSGLIPGTYQITVKNAQGCTSVTGNIVINPAPNAPAVATIDVDQTDCDTATGTITVTAPVGAGLTYSIDGETFGSTMTFAGLIPGTYVITVKNAGGCTSVTNDIVINSAPTAPAVANVTPTQPTCTEPTGTITVNAPLGAGLTYAIDGETFVTTTEFEGLIPGTYQITVKNAAGCTSVTGNIVIDSVPNAPDVATATPTQPTCDTTTGTITVTAPAGAGLTYSIDGTEFDTDMVFEDLIPGTYQVTVKNAEGCISVTGNIVINNAPTGPDAPIVAVTPPTCTEPTGSISITNAAAGLTYSIDGETFVGDTTFAGLVPGTYTITVKNAAGCTAETNNIIVDPAANAPAPPAVSFIQPTCATPTGTLIVTNPEAGFTYSIDGEIFVTATEFAGLIPGIYSITVKNGDGCTSITINLIINNVPDGPAAASVATTAPTCAEPTGTITVTAPTEAGMTYSIDGTNFQPELSFEGLTPGGTYTVTVKNAEGCTSVSAAITIDVLPAGPAIAGTQGCTSTVFGSNYVLEGQPLDNSFDADTATYEWRTMAGVVIGNNESTFNVTQYASDNGIDPESFPMQFELTVITETGCESTYVFTVDSPFCEIPRGISPNDDTLNDNFDITGLNARKVSIFNRYGMEVYAKNDYTNEWYGQSDNGDELPTGTYYYIIETTSKSFTGWVYINREEN